MKCNWKYYIESNWEKSVHNNDLSTVPLLSLYLATYLSFSVIGFKFYRFCRFYRITRELKKSKMLPPLGSKPQAPDFQVLHATPHLTPLCAGSLSSSDPYVVLLYWSQKNSKSKNQ